AEELGHRGDVARYDRRAAGHCLEDRKARPLVERGEDEELAAAIEGGEHAVLDEAGELNVVPADPLVAGERPELRAVEPREVPGDHQLVPSPQRLREPGVAGDRTVEVLAVVLAADVEEEARAD